MKDILDQQNKLLRIEDLKNRYGLDRVDVLLYNAIKIKLNKWLKKDTNSRFLRPEYSIDIDTCLFMINDMMLNVKLAKSKQYYEILIKKKYEIPNSVRYWHMLGMLDENRILKSMAIYRNSTKETYLLALQLKIIHNIVATGKKMKDWKLSMTDNCRYCNKQEDVLHFFWDCNFTKELIDKCKCSINIENMSFDKWDFLLGTNQIADDNIALIIKYYIYKVRQNNTMFSAKEFRQEIKIRMVSDKVSLPARIYNVKWVLSDINEEWM